jgi:hypothetical protein
MPVDRHLIIQIGCWAFSEESYFDPNTMSFTGMVYLWRAGDVEGEVLDVLFQASVSF